jgi:hypothetical protein
MDGVDNAVGAFFVVTGALWQLLAGLIVVAAGYLVISMTLGYGMSALRAWLRRRRAAGPTAPEVNSDH